MRVFEFLTPATYLVLILVWGYVLVVYLRQFGAAYRVRGGPLTVLLLVLAIDAGRTLFESLYFGASYSSRFGLLPGRLHEFLDQPQMLFLPKALNLLAGLLILTLLLRRLLPALQRERVTQTQQIARLRREIEAKERVEAQLRQIIDLVPHSIFAKDQEGRFLLVNQACAGIYGTTVDGLTGRLQGDVHENPNELARMLADDREVLRSGRIKFIPTEAFLDGAGKEHLFQTIKLPYTTIDGVQAVLGVATDVTELKRAERAQRKSEALSQSIIDHAGIGIAHGGLDGRVVHVNRAYESMLGYGRGELDGRSWVEWTHPDDQAANLALFRELADGRRSSFKLEKRYIRKDGGTLWVNVTVTSVRPDPETAPELLIALVEDITQRRTAEAALRRSEATALALINAPQDAMMVLVDPEGRLLALNDPVARSIGKPREELLGTRVYDHFPPAVAQRREAMARRVLDTGEPVRFEDQRAGRTFDNSLYPVKDAEGATVSVAAFVREVTAEKRANAQLRLDAAVIAHTPEGVMVTDARLRILSVNPAFSTTTGYAPEEVLGMTPSILRSGRHDSAYYRAMWQALQETGSWQGEIWNRRKNGEIYPEWLHINGIRDDQGEITHYAGIFSDLASHEHMRKRLHYLAYYDPLTDLPNRELLRDRLDMALHNARRTGTMAGLLFLDLDRFKQINDTLGHSVGDRLLSRVAERLRGVVRESDTVARLGGDEFVAVLTEIAGAEDAARVARKMLGAFGTPFDLDGRELYTTPSLGICLYPDNGEDAETLLKNADTAMYRAKDLGGNGFQFYTPEMSGRFDERLALEHDLRRALERGQLSLVYQPQVCLRDGRIVGVEALARWHHPERGWIPPTVFIAIAEETDLIGPLGAWVLRTACAAARDWCARAPEFRLAVNLSAHQLRQPDLAEQVVEALGNAGLQGRDLELELTETALMENAERTADALTRLGALGVHLAIDDFGTGYSSLGYLKRFAVQTLKIDRSFVRDIVEDSDDAEIAATVVAMGHNLKLEVVAEGVETPEQLAFLRARGCDRVQGYLFSRPVSPEEIDRMLEGGILAPSPNP